MIYKLTYLDYDTAISDLLEKGVLINSTDIENKDIVCNSPSTAAVVHIGLIEGRKEWHVDIMTDEIIEFSNEIKPNNPIHIFA